MDDFGGFTCGTRLPGEDDAAEMAAHLADAGDVPADDASGCVHEDAVYWNPYNRVVQCHRCGIVFVPAFSPTATYR